MRVPRPHRSFDVLMMTDCRFPGGNSSSVVEEIVAQVRAGYRTGVLHAPSPVLGRVRAFNPKLRRLIESEQVELVVGARTIETRLLLARHPTVFSELPDGLPEIRAEQVVLAANQVPEDDRSIRAYYDVDVVAANLDRLAGRRVAWSPIGPEVRRVLEGRVPLADRDWENILDVERWSVERTGLVGRRPVIGRHSRGHWTKWPDDPAEILRAYPDDPRYPVRVLGGIDAPVRLLGHRPANWVSFEFDEIDPVAFLAGIDVFVYFHHPGLVEAFGRVVLEAMSAGAVCIVPPYLQQLFGDACLYGSPADVVPLVDEVTADVGSFLERSRRGVQLAMDRFSYAAHVGRVDALIGPPSVEPLRPVRRSARPSSKVVTPRTLIVDVGSDDGDTHPLTRAAVDALAIAPGAVVRLTSASVVATEGCGPVGSGEVRCRGSELVETVPAAAAHLPAVHRSRYVLRRVAELVAVHGVRRIVVVADDHDDLARDCAAIVPATWSGARVVGSGSACGQGAQGMQGMQTPPFEPPTGWSLRHVCGEGPVEAAAGLSLWTRWRAAAVGRSERVKPLVSPALRWFRRREDRLRRMTRRARGLPEDGGWSSPPPWDLGGYATHPDPSALPTVVAVVLDEKLGDELLQQLVEREQIMSGFRSVALVPVDLEPVASALGVVAETYVPADCWRAAGRGGWWEYLERRVRTTRAEFGATSVVLLGGAGVDGPVDTAGMLLRVLSATE